MKKILLPFFLFFLVTTAFSQSDTTVKYYSKYGKETTKDSALTYIKFFKQDNWWHGSEYFIKKNILKSDGNYATQSVEKPVGSFNNFSEDGRLNYTADYADGKPVEKTYYYKNGNKKSWIHYEEKGENQQKGWDETGKELKKYVVEREARFKGGMEGWRKFLEKHLNANVAADAGAPEGNYEVVLQFVITKEGYVSQVKAISVPAKCKPCGPEAVRVISEVPEWEPAIQNNEPVIYQAIQHVTFQVLEDKKKTKG